VATIKDTDDLWSKEATTKSTLFAVKSDEKIKCPASSNVCLKASASS